MGTFILTPTVGMDCWIEYIQLTNYGANYIVNPFGFDLTKLVKTTIYVFIFVNKYSIYQKKPTQIFKVYLIYFAYL